MKKLFCISSFILSTLVSIGQHPGYLDTGFGNQGIATFDISGLSNSISAMKPTSGGIISAGTSSEWEGSRGFLLKTDTEGNIDNSFGTNGKVDFDFGGDNSYVNDMVVLTDGRILVCGISEEAGNTSIGLAKFTSEGQPDPLFGYSGTLIVDLGAYETANSVVLSNNKFLITGSYENGADMDVLVMRFLANGSVDNSFGTEGKVIIDLNNNSEDAPKGMIASSNTYTIASYALHNDYDAIALIQLNTDGNLVSGFGTGGISVYDGMQILSGIIFAETAISRDLLGRFYVSGRFEGIEGDDPAIIRFQSNGAPDNYFGNYGLAVYQIPGDNVFKCLMVQPDGYIVAAGSSNSGNISTLILRAEPWGTPDPGFGFGNGYAIHQLGAGNSQYDVANCMLPQNSYARILLGGSANTATENTDAIISAYYSDLSINSSFENVSSQLIAYSDPGNGNLIVIKGISKPGQKIVQIYCADGKKVFEGKAVETSGEMRVKPETKLAAGVYIVRVSGNSFSETVKLLIDGR